jgi:serine protease Do
MHKYKPVKYVIAFLLFSFWTLPALALDSPAVKQAERPAVTLPNFADMAEKLLPAVVNVSTTQIVKQKRGSMPDMQFPPGSPFEEFFKDFMDRNMQGQNGDGDDEGDDGKPSSRKSTALGSGFIIDSSGLIVTNNHVIAEADEITVILHDNTELKAEIAGRDTKMDLALLRVKTDKKLVAVPWGDSDTVRVGEWVLAIGNPFGLGGSVTAGIVSARARDINAGPYDDFIQTDASINRGNSGGPMFNVKGEVIGINTAIFSPSGGSVGIGFSIPSSSAKPVIDQLIKYGRTKRGWMGVKIQGVSDEIAENFGLKGSPRGALVAAVTPGGPAEAAKMEVGDIILKFDGKDVPDVRKLPRIVAESPIGQSVEVVLWRKNREVTTKIKVGQLEDAEDKNLIPASGDDSKSKPSKPAAKSKVMGMSLSPITQPLRSRYEIPADVKNGAVVIGTDASSTAADQGVRAGDVITQVAQQDVSSPDEAIEKINKAKSDKKKSVLLLLNRAGEMRFVALKFEE